MRTHAAAQKKDVLKVLTASKKSMTACQLLERLHIGKTSMATAAVYRSPTALLNQNAFLATCHIVEIYGHVDPPGLILFNEVNTDVL
ncbi:hypothetical protein [Phaeobacter porticola]|uniref:Putative metal ion uptake regulator n=1 Tax=Phaeobacter porticola TaxID=1844006 RepID=A0A1L3I1W5_9RHOB|nr:hypothetical protein [Phaeobacter porticola]APG46094.1 putative metal ion uptake regulator [Phaeobacter porticola]